MNESLKVNSGKDYKHLSNGAIPVYGTGGYMLSVDDKLSEQDSIGIGRKGTINKPQYLKAPFWTVDTLFFMTPFKQYNINFIYSMAQQINWKKLDESTGVPSLSKVNIEKISQSFPVYEEQVKIGAFFLHLDNTIALHQRELELLKEMKQGFLQKMVLQKEEKVPTVRFANFVKEWEQRKLIDVVNRISTSSDKEDLPRVEYEDIISGEGQLNKNIFHKKKNKKGIKFQPGDILFGKLRPYLKNWLLSDFNGIAVGDFWVLRPPKVDDKFIYSLIQSNRYQNVSNQSTGTKMPRSDWNVVSNTNFGIPLDIKEQAQIGNFFKQLDNTIVLHQNKIEKLKVMKQAFLQKMFV